MFPFSPAQQVKEFFELVEPSQTSLLFISAQCLVWNRNLPNFSPLHTDGFSPYFFPNTGIRDWKNGCKWIYSFLSRIFNNPWPFEMVISATGDSKFYPLPSEKENTVTYVHIFYDRLAKHPCQLRNCYILLNNKEPKVFVEPFAFPFYPWWSAMFHKKQSVGNF